MVPGCLDDTSHRHPECPGEWHDTVVHPRRQLHEDRPQNSPLERNMLRQNIREHQNDCMIGHKCRPSTFDTAIATQNIPKVMTAL
jgi:hypothetical protein